MTQNPPPDLLSLPNELLAKICVYAVDEEPSMRGKNWLRAVRLTCKLLYTPATEELAKRFFKSLAVMVSRRSLQELVTFCKHDLIGPYIEEIVFHPCQLNARFLSKIQDDMYTWMARRDLVAIAKARRHIQWYFTKLEDEIRLEESGDAKMFFEQAFGALRALQKPIKLTLTTKMSLDVMLTHGGRRNSRPGIEEFLSFSEAVFAHGGGMAFISTIFEAAVAAGSQIHTLEAMLEDELVNKTLTDQFCSACRSSTSTSNGESGTSTISSHTSISEFFSSVFRTISKV